MRYKSFILLILFVSIPIAVYAEIGNVLTTSPQGYQSTGVISDVGVPTNEGEVPEAGKPSLVPFKSLAGPLSIDMDGVGDNCSAGSSSPEFWTLDINNKVDSKEKLLQEIVVAINSDKRLRKVHIFDDSIDMYYLQPAYRWGFLPMNYYLHISANGTTFHMSLEKPDWLGSSSNFHQKVTEAFSVNAPILLNDEVVEALKTNGTIARNGKMIEVISAMMYQVNIKPIANSYFVCYVLPFLIYIIFGLLIAGIVVWFIIKRSRRTSGFAIHKVKNISDRNNEDEDDSPMFPGMK